MVRLYGQEFTRAEIQARMGGIDQVAGVRRIRLQDGPEDNVSAVEVRTGGGLSYTVLPSRAMDISAAECDGIPIAWRSGVGDMHPAYVYKTGGFNLGWFGGLLTTCGLDNIGTPGEDELGTFAQHGNLTGVAARNVSYGARWEGERYLMWVEGESRQREIWEANAYDVVVRRRIESELGGRTIRITDTFENMGRTPAPHLVLYHINVGFPLVSSDSEIIARSRAAIPSRDGGGHDPSAARIADPKPDLHSEVHMHELVPDADGMGRGAIVNERLGIGLALRFPVAELPYLNQWKSLVAKRYVVAIEPINSRGGNRARQRENGTLPFLAPDEIRTFHVDITVLRGAEEIAAARAEMAV